MIEKSGLMLIGIDVMCEVTFYKCFPNMTLTLFVTEMVNPGLIIEMVNPGSQRW